MNKRLYISIFLSTFVIGMNSFAHTFDRYERGFLYDIVMLLLSILLFICLITFLLNIIYLFGKSRYKEFKNYLPGITLFTSVLIIFSPIFREDELAPTNFVTCYEGTQNRSVGFFRADHSFEIHATGVFGYNKWHLGAWRKVGDTLFLRYKTETHSLLSDTNLIQNGYVSPITPAFSKEGRGFYLGNCRGEN